VAFPWQLDIFTFRLQCGLHEVYHMRFLYCSCSCQSGPSDAVLGNCSARLMTWEGVIIDIPYTVPSLTHAAWRPCILCSASQRNEVLVHLFLLYLPRVRATENCAAELENGLTTRQNVLKGHVPCRTAAQTSYSSGKSYSLHRTFLNTSSTHVPFQELMKKRGIS